MARRWKLRASPERLLRADRHQIRPRESPRRNGLGRIKNKLLLGLMLNKNKLLLIPPAPPYDCCFSLMARALLFNSLSILPKIVRRASALRLVSVTAPLSQSVIFSFVNGPCCLM